MTSQSDPGGAVPAQAWAHRDGLVHLQPLAASSWSPEAVVARLQIAGTFYRFAIGHDEARIDVLESCFAAEGVLQVAQGHPEPFTTHRGRAAVGAPLRHLIGPQDGPRRH